MYSVYFYNIYTYLYSFLFSNVVSQKKNFKTKGTLSIVRAEIQAESYLEQSIQEWTKQNLWKATFKNLN